MVQNLAELGPNLQSIKSMLEGRDNLCLRQMKFMIML